MKWNLLKFRRLNMQKFTSSNRQKYRTNQKYVEKSWSLPKFWRSKRQKYCSNRWNEAKNKISRRKVTNQTNLQCLPAFGKLTSTITLTNLKNAYLLLVSLPPRKRLSTSKTLTCLPNALWPQTIVMPKTYFLGPRLSRAPGPPYFINYKLSPYDSYVTQLHFFSEFETSGHK